MVLAPCDSRPASRLWPAGLVTTGLLAAAFVAAMGAAGCGGDAEPLGEGVLRTSWQVSPRGCESAEVETVQVSLRGEATRDEQFGCEEGEAEIEGLPPGNYRLTLRGLDQGGDATFASGETTVTVRADVITEAEHLRLTALPSRVTIGWRFDDGRVCGANDVDRIEVALFDMLDYEVTRVDFACDAGEGVIEDLTAGEYLVEAVAYSTAGEPSHQGTANFQVERGDQAVVDLVLDPSP